MERKRNTGFSCVWRKGIGLLTPVVAFWAVSLGCERAPTGPVADSRSAAVSDQPQRQRDFETPSAENASETWQVHYIQDAKVGYGRMTIAPQENGLVRIESEEQITMNRGGSSVTQKVTLTSVEKPGGELVRFESRVNLGPTATVSRGEVVNGALQLETETQGKTVADAIPWRREWGGFFAVDHAMKSDPLEPGEARTLQALQPLLNQVGEIRLTARDWEETPLLVGARRLLRIDGSVRVAGIEIDVTSWVDEKGETWKTVLPSLQQTSYRASRDLALSKDETASYDLFDDITIRLETPLTKGHDTQRAVYRATLEKGNPATAFASGATQTVREIDERTAEITVRAVRPDQPPKPPADLEPPTADDLKPNSLIQSDDPRIVQMAASVAPDETDPWKIAVALEQWVHGAITEKNFSQAFASAAEVAQSREGDCTEHAVLLMALCRARKIPARGAMGLVYFPQPEGAGFAYHMWTEVWITDRWIPLDGTLGRGGVGGGHLKIAHSNLEGAGPFAAFLPVFRILGQLELEVVEQE